MSITGVVQGVGFRYFVRNRAKALGLDGYVRNLPDGSVEVVAEGERPAVAVLLEDLKTGPRHARVERVNIEWQEPRREFGGFDYAV
jgi:acylphosphatase